MPDGVVGHSVGDIAALHESGVLDLREAIRLVWHRGHIMQQATGLGRMASVGLTEAEANEFVGLYGDRLSVGAINGPRSVVLSGEIGSAGGGADDIDGQRREPSHAASSVRVPQRADGRFSGSTC